MDRSGNSEVAGASDLKLPASGSCRLTLVLPVPRAQSHQQFLVASMSSDRVDGPCQRASELLKMRPHHLTKPRPRLDDDGLCRWDELRSIRLSVVGRSSKNNQINYIDAGNNNRPAGQ